MTKELSERRKSTLKHREEKLNRLYGERANNTLKTAEEYFATHPERSHVDVKLKVSNQDVKIFYIYLRNKATDESWEFWITKRPFFFLTRKVRVYINPSACWFHDYYSDSEVYNKYQWMLCELVKD